MSSLAVGFTITQLPGCGALEFLDTTEYGTGGGSGNLPARTCGPSIPATATSKILTNPNPTVLATASFTITNPGTTGNNIDVSVGGVIIGSWATTPFESAPDLASHLAANINTNNPLYYSAVAVGAVVTVTIGLAFNPGTANLATLLIAVTGSLATNTLVSQFSGGIAGDIFTLSVNGVVYSIYNEAPGDTPSNIAAGLVANALGWHGTITSVGNAVTMTGSSSSGASLNGMQLVITASEGGTTQIGDFSGGEDAVTDCIGSTTIEFDFDNGESVVITNFVPTDLIPETEIFAADLGYTGDNIPDQIVTITYTIYDTNGNVIGIASQPVLFCCNFLACWYAHSQQAIGNNCCTAKKLRELMELWCQFLAIQASVGCNSCCASGSMEQLSLECSKWCLAGNC